MHIIIDILGWIVFLTILSWGVLFMIGTIIDSFYNWHLSRRKSKEANDERD
jgi:hypothetical protein